MDKRILKIYSYSNWNYTRKKSFVKGKLKKYIMVQFISVFLALVINFLVLETNQYRLGNNKYYRKLGFPY